MSIKFCSLSSGSSGNCHYIEGNNSRILVDAGFSGKRIQELLDSIDVCPTSLDGIFVTHEHIDHVQGVGVLSRRFDLPIFANRNTWEAMKDRIGKIDESNTRVIKTNEYMNFLDLDIKPINIYHDASEPVAYIVHQGKKKLSLITDTGMIDRSQEKELAGSDILFIESNHDEFMLEEGLYPRHLKTRISSINGHLSNKDAAETLERILKGNREIVVLGHLSKDNNVPELAYETNKERLEAAGLDVDQYINLKLSYRNRTTEVFQV